MPNLDRLNLKAEAVHGITVSTAQFMFAVTYGISYALVVLALACVAFERKDFD